MPDNVPVWGYFIIFLFVHLLWLIAFCPGIMTDDAAGQLLMCIWGNYNDHHPIASSFLMYGILKLGRVLFHSDNAGIFIYLCLQASFQTVTFTYCFELFRRKGTCLFIRVLTFFFYCIFPVFANMSVVYCKDIGYGISCLLCLVMTELCFGCEEHVKGKRQTATEYFLLLLSLSGMCLFRHEGKFIALTALLFMLIGFGNHRKIISRIILMIIILLIMNKAVISAFHVEKGPVRETLSVPIMMTAGYVGRYGNEISAEDERILYSVFDVDDLEDLYDALDYEISDELKAHMIYAPGKAALGDYFSFMLRSFFDHPGVFFETYFKHADGYFNPLREKFETGDSFTYIMTNEKYAGEYLCVSYSGNRYLRDLLRGYYFFWDDNPVLGILLNPGLYTLIMLIEMVLLIAFRKAKKLFYYIPAIVLLGVITLSPVNGSLRYALPLMLTMPLYLELTVSQLASIFTRRKSSAS